jgi:uncharacterized protein (DUF885 family)
MGSTPETAVGPAAEFDRMVADYYHAWFRFHPEAAVEAGVGGFDGRLAPFCDDDVGALLTLNQELLGGIEEFDVDALDADRQLDCRLLYGAAVLEMDRLLHADWRRREPARYLPVNAIYQLTVRPVADFASALASRLVAIPEYLRGARRMISESPELVPPAWLASAVEEARTGAEYLRDLPRHPRVVNVSRRLQGLDGAIANAVEALQGYAEYLETDVARSAAGDFACGRDYFDSLLQYRHGLGVNADRLYRFGSDLFEQTRRNLVDSCRELAGNDDVEALTARIQADHPPAESLLDEYRTQMLAARHFLEHHDLVSVPQGQQLEVVDTPVFLRQQIPFAAYMEPAPNDPEQHGYYYVTPASDEASLGEHNRSGLMHTCVHEAWPGHHLQFVTANLGGVSATLPRFLNPSATLYEGWALYSEQLMHEQGFLDRPEQRFLLLKDRLWRALRIMIDVDIHTRGVSLEDAAQRLVTHLGFTPDQARAELNWYSHAPTTPMGYATGWALINAVRDRVRLEQRESFDLKSFHDRLLSAGSPALAMMVERVFGRELWLAARKMVFPE